MSQQDRVCPERNGDNQLKELQRFRNNRRNCITVTTPVMTDMIRIVAIKDFFTAQKPRPSIQEIQVYAKR